MENSFQNEECYHKAKKRVEEIKGFHGHLIAFVIINVGLFLFNTVTFPNQLWFDYWFYWQLLIWGIGVVIHGLKVFNCIPFFNKNWEDNKIKELLEKEEQSKTTWK